MPMAGNDGSQTYEMGCEGRKAKGVYMGQHCAAKTVTPASLVIFRAAGAIMGIRRLRPSPRGRQSIGTGEIPINRLGAAATHPFSAAQRLLAAPFHMDWWQCMPEPLSP